MHAYTHTRDPSCLHKPKLLGTPSVTHETPVCLLKSVENLAPPTETYGQAATFTLETSRAQHPTHSEQVSRPKQKQKAAIKLEVEGEVEVGK